MPPHARRAVLHILKGRRGGVVFCDFGKRFSEELGPAAPSAAIASHLPPAAGLPSKGGLNPWLKKCSGGFFPLNAIGSSPRAQPSCAGHQIFQ